ncbi:MAG: carboxypeptidase regulatory-like domain-containing protein [Acidobacteria bacterium]|nr:carboxypeptidase regulatory-like domain-containing protein [Acidobacteriota bacterium]
MKQALSRASGWLGCLLVALVLTCGTGSVGLAQVSSQLTGIVTDQQGAVVPNASIVLTSDQTGDNRKTVSNSEGYFTFAAIPASVYTVTIEATGFAKWVRKGVTLSPGDRRTLTEITLGAAGTTGSVDISATPDDIAPIDTGEKSATISEKQIQNLSLNGRNAAELIKILPGFTPVSSSITNSPNFDGGVTGINGNGDAGQQSFVGNYSANGTRTDALDIAIDGARATDPGCNCATPINPNVDMIQEFKVQQGNFSAENARGPVVISGVTKGGSKDFHGMAYIYARHFSLNANRSEANQVGQPRPENQFYYPGGNVSGPVVIPGTGFNKNRDKLFFFAGYEYIRQRLDSGLLQSWVPTAAMRTGDFSDRAYVDSLKGAANITGQVCVPPTDGTALPNYCAGPGRIAANAIDAGGRALINTMPLPNTDPRLTSNGFNYAQQVIFDQNNTQFTTRVDYSISENTKLYGKFGRQSELQPFPVGLWWRNNGQVPYPTRVVAENRSYSSAVNLTHVFNPTLTNEVVFGVSYINFPNNFEDPKKISRSALGYPYQGIYKNKVEQIPAFTTWGGGPTVLNPGGFEYGNNGQTGTLFSYKWLPSITDNVTWVKGTHSMKFGAYWDFVINSQPNSGWTNGIIGFANWSGDSTGNGFSNLLTGRIGSYEELERNILNNIGWKSYQFYAQDAWKIKSNVTLEYGLRMAHLGGIYDREGTGLAVWDPVKYKNNPIPGVSWHALDKSIPLSGRSPKALYPMPRFGLAWDVFKTGKTVLRGGFGTYFYGDNQQGYTNPISVANRVRSISPAVSTLRALETTSGGAAGIPTNLDVIDPNDDKQPVVHSWSFTVTQRLPWQMQLEASYVGNQANDLINLGKQNINPVPLGTRYTPAELTDCANNANCDADVRKRLSNAQTGFSYQSINLLGHNTYSNYHALQTLLSRQVGRVNATMSYTFSKNLGIRGAGQSARGTAAENNAIFGLRDRNYGVLATDRTHVLAIAYNVFLPDLGKKLGDNKAAVAVFDGWQVTGITQFASGPNLQASFVNFNMQVVGAGETLNGRSVFGSPDTTLQPLLTCDPSKGLAKDEFVKLSCFAPPSVTNGAFRNGPYIMPYMRGPSFYNNDLSLFKSWNLTESKRLQFRVSGFNFLNHPLKTLTDANVTLRFENGQPTQATKDLFGKYTDNKVGRRQIQLALKFFF